MGENEVLHDSVTDFILLDIKTRLIRERGFCRWAIHGICILNPPFLKRRYEKDLKFQKRESVSGLLS